MTASEPAPESPSAPGPIDGLEDRVPDMEELLQSLEGVESVRIIPGDRGSLEEIHVLSEAGLEPKKVVRNVESALLAEAGVKIDHRIISVAQRRASMPDTETPREEGPEKNGARATVDSGSAPAPGEEPDEPTAADPSGEGVTSDRLVLESVHLERRAGEKIVCTVTLSDGDTHEGRATGMDHRNTRLTVVGKAALDAVREVTDPARTLMLDGVETVDAFGGQMVVALVHAMKNRRATPLVGAALVEDSREETAVLAVLDATNRWVGNA